MDASEKELTAAPAMSKATSEKVVEPDLKRAVAMVVKMMAIRGKSGNEGPILRFVTDALARAGLARSAMRFDRVQLRSPIEGQTGNLIVKLPGVGALKRRPRRLLMAHVDTVPICVGSRPVRRGAVIRSADPCTGLGADNRSGAAAI